MPWKDLCSEQHSPSNREVLLHTQAPASGDDSISMILSAHPSCQQSLPPLTILIFTYSTEPRGSAQPHSQLRAGHTQSPSSFPGRRRREAWKTQSRARIKHSLSWPSLAGPSSVPWLLPCAPGPALARGEPTCSGAAADKPG